MDILLRSARIIDTGSPFHNQVKDILVSKGKIKKIGSKVINTSKVHEVKTPNLHVSLGWFDLNTYLADPGFEHKETISSACKAAAAGGFTHICAMPNTAPPVHSKSQIDYVLRKAAEEVVTVHPIGAVTANTDGKELAEMYDMHRAGAIAFSDGLKPSPTAGITERALLYVKAFNGLVMNHPEEKSISKNGVMHEGPVSTKAGLPGAPGLAEEIAVNRDLYLLEYTDSRLHILNVSLKKSAELIKQAKRKGLKVSSSVNAYNLLLNEKHVENYNSLFKLNPHLRSESDVTYLAKALAEGTIDTITSAHQPHEDDCKKLEFDKAEYGMIGLETCFAVANTALKGKVELPFIVSALANNPRKILGLENKIEEGALADLTLFNPETKWTFTVKDIKSKSKNTPLIGTEFIGKSLGIINGEKVHLNY